MTTPSPYPRRSRAFRRMLWWVTVAIVTPIALLVLLEALAQVTGIFSLPRWLRSIGIVTAIQGQVLLVAIAAIIFAVGVMVYAVTSLITPKED